MAGFLLPISLLVNLALAYAESKVSCTDRSDPSSDKPRDLLFLHAPENVTTANWAVMRQWEFSHAVNAAVTLLAFCLSIAAALEKIEAKQGVSS